MKTQTFLLLVSLLICSISLLMCSNDDDDDDNDNDNNQLAPDYFEGTNCTGYDLPSCDTDLDSPPELISVAFLVNGTEVKPPVIVHPLDELNFAIEFEYPNDHLCGGHIFLIKGGETLCMDNDGLPSDIPYPFGIPGICSTVAMGEPFVYKFDPANFLNGEGAPYFLEISNACATRSNRLPLDIVTVAE